MSNKIVLLGTYWNESEWVGRSLRQIEAINPDVVILCDGCFDERKENRSTDGTASVLRLFCDNKPGRYLFKAVRQGRLASGFELFKAGFRGIFSLPYFYWVLRHLCFTNKYRLNQAVTFQRMLRSAAKVVGDNFWFLTLDADQFYSDELVSMLRRKLADVPDRISLLTAQEYTFNEGFNYFSTSYEKRTWNNMPHRYSNSTKILPTRDIVIASILSIKHYHRVCDKLDVGHYFHYKFRNDKSREAEGYSLGDRKPPEAERFLNTVEFGGVHPEAISRWGDD